MAEMQNRLRGSNVTRAQQNGSSNTPPRTPQRRSNANPRRARETRDFREYGPTRVADKSTSGVGLLEAEFFGSIFLLILLVFADNKVSYGDKIMSLMKRGTLTMFLFFILALISGVGPNASKIAKALGGLVFFGILVTAPVNTMLTEMQTFIRADWVGTGEHGSDVGSADIGTQSNTQGGALGQAGGAIQRIIAIIGQGKK
jgi:hypothetical protein